MISITLPSIYPEPLRRALKNIRDATRGPHEIIVVSPEQPPDFPNVRWIYEDPAVAKGCNAGHARGAREATGDFVLAWVDDHCLADGWDVEARRDYADREAVFHADNPDKPYVLGLRHVWPTHVGTLFGIYYPYFPFVRRSYLEQTSGWFDTAYEKGFADSDFALRVWHRGGRCEWSQRPLIVVTLDDNRKEGVIMTDADMALSVQRWAPIYGKGWDSSHLRGFNNDLTPERFPQFVDATKRSIFYNDPEFKAVVGTGG